MNPRPVIFGGVERPNAQDVALRQDLMREHAASKDAARQASLGFVPRLLPVHMGAATISAASWDLVIAVDGGTIYLPGLGPSDAGDEVHVLLKTGGATVVVDTDAVMNGVGVLAGPVHGRYIWDGAEWWVG